MPDKSLIGAPYRLALAAIDRGWLWRQEIIWHKPNPLPESVRDRYQRSHETILHLTRTPKYYAVPRAEHEPLHHDVWTIPVESYRDPQGRRHPAVFPLELAARLIDAYCPPGGVVADPFTSATTLVAAQRLGRRAWGCDLNEEYVSIARDRLAAP